MHIVIGVSLGTLLGLVLLVWFLFNAWRSGVRKRRLQKLRARQEAARVRAIEKALREPLSTRIQNALLRRK